ncbi:MAG: flavodoxin family protein [Victivallaceae bacterium]|nr:flavodoxin family protein [Victivallaceae bacterium]
MEKADAMSRRDALKMLGAVAIGSALGIKGAQAAEIPSRKQEEKKAMKVILVNGSPHKKGCTFTALSEVAATLNKHKIETEIFWIGNDIQGGCIACDFCRKNARCFRPDSVNSFVEKAKLSDGFIFGSPVHYAAPSGSMLSFMIRAFFSTGGSDVFTNKPAASVVSCRRAGSTGALDTMNKFYPINGMPMVPSQYWNMVHGNRPEEVRQDLEGLQIMRTLAEKMAWMLQNIAAGRLAQLPAPTKEAPVRTNFIRS